MEGAVQQQEKRNSCGRGKDRAHPKTQLTEVTILNDGQYGGTAQEHGHLENN